ncbi:MAG: hypothetical protein BWX71_02346 [Deltaproteobacteria bacterium ADurb.Bin072]|nr:MAG: hypothetical protein BWX71_02346 [Deltaproteobacteria bacterium ADurb.Bin072]
MTWVMVSRPTRSPVAKMAVLGRPSGAPKMASTSGMVNPSSSMAVRVAPMPWMPMRLPMKFGVSLAQTMPLPSLLSPNSATKSRTSFLVSSPGMISSRCMYRTGLKKCVPRKCSLKPLLKPSDMALSGIPEVLEDTMASALRTLSMRAKSCCLILRFSTTTSMIQSHSASLSKSSSRLPVEMRPA